MDYGFNGYSIKYTVYTNHIRFFVRIAKRECERGAQLSLCNTFEGFENSYWHWFNAVRFINVFFSPYISSSDSDVKSASANYHHAFSKQTISNKLYRIENAYVHLIRVFSSISRTSGENLRVFLPFNHLLVMSKPIVLIK